MAGRFSADVRKWANQTKQGLEDVLKSSVEDFVATASKTQESWRTREGPAKPGLLPRDSGHAVNTVAAQLNGSGQFEIDEQNDVILVIQGMKPGDDLHISWTAAYSRVINSGFSGIDSLGRNVNRVGVHFVERAAEEWSEIVAANARELSR